MKQQQLDLQESDTDLASQEQRREERNEEASSSKGAAKPLSKQKRSQRLSTFKVSNIVISKEIKTCTELLTLASAQKAEQKTDLAELLSTEAVR